MIGLGGAFEVRCSCLVQSGTCDRSGNANDKAKTLIATARSRGREITIYTSSMDSYHQTTSASPAAFRRSLGPRQLLLLADCGLMRTGWVSIDRSRPTADSGERRLLGSSIKVFYRISSGN